MISIASTVSGPIEAIEIIDAYTAQLTVLGQTVIIDDRTRLKGVLIDDVVVGNIADISGLIDENGRIVGSFLEKTAAAAMPDEVYHVSGPVSGLGAGTFAINNLAVDYSGAQISGFSSTGIDNGVFVSVSGRIESGTPGTLVADTIQPYRLLGDLADGDNLKFSGYVFDQPSANRFHINGYLAEVGSDTQYIGGTDTDILPGLKIEVEGYFSDGVIIVQALTFSASLKAESNLIQKNDTALTLELAGLTPLTVRTNSLTRYIGVAANFEELAVGGHLVIRGRMVDDQTAVAQQVQALPSAPGLDRAEILGTASAIGEPLITVNGVQIDTDTIPSGGFHAYTGEAITQEEFFAMVGEDDFVEAKGDLLMDDTVAWQSISLVQLQ